MKRVVLVLAALSGACTPTYPRVPGSIRHTATNPPLGFSGAFRLSVETPADERPLPERKGADPQTAHATFFLFGYSHSARGSFVTSALEVGLNLPFDLAEMTRDYLARARIFREVVLAPKPADFLLRARIHHLYGMRFIRSASSGVYLGRNYASSSRSVSLLAPVGNAVVSYELVDQRSGRPRVVWRDTLSGQAVATADLVLRRSHGAPGHAFHGLPAKAVSEMLTRLASSLHRVLRRLDALEGEAPPPAIAPGFQFTVHRVTRTRAAVERLVLEYPTGRVVSFRTEPATLAPSGAPGDWLLSRRLPSGEEIGGERYEAMARGLARVFDLRRLDDATHYHFFGRRGDAGAGRARGPVRAAPPKER